MFIVSKTSENSVQNQIKYGGFRVQRRCFVVFKVKDKQKSFVFIKSGQSELRLNQLGQNE